MSLDLSEIKNLLERLIFEETSPQDWAEDVWGLSPLMGDSAVKLLEVFYKLLELCPDRDLETLLTELYRTQMEREAEP